MSRAEVLKSLWKDPVWSAVIATAIVGVAGAGGTYLLNLWPTFGRFAASIAESAAAPSQMANWIVWLVCVLAVLGVVAAFAFVWRLIRPARPNEDLWRSYTRDTFFGLTWRWKYYSDGSLKDLLSFCPYCDFQVFPNPAGDFVVLKRIGFHCDSCGRDLGQFDEAYASLESKVGRFIQQKLRSGLVRAA